MRKKMTDNGEKNLFLRGPAAEGSRGLKKLFHVECISSRIILDIIF